MNKIKKGDQVVILSGSFKKQTGEVKAVMPSDNQVIVKGINLRTRVSKTGNEKKLVKREYPLHISNVALSDPKTGQATRVGFKVENGKKVRVAKKSGTTVK